MASIRGFQMKKVKRTFGTEGYGCTATLYLDGKKIGTYADYGDGAMGNISYISKDAEIEMVRFIIAYAKECENDFMIGLYRECPERFREECERFKKYHPYIPDEDITIKTMASNSIEYVVSDFLKLLDNEKEFKKYIKQGYKAISIDGNMVSAYPPQWSNEKIEKAAKGAKVYYSLTDFCIH